MFLQKGFKLIEFSYFYFLIVSVKILQKGTQTNYWVKNACIILFKMFMATLISHGRTNP
jgi:hypothetical protein